MWPCGWALFGAAHLALAKEQGLPAAEAEARARPEALPAPPASSEPYRPLRYDEDFTALRDVRTRTDWLDPLKLVALDSQGHFYLTLGGEARERYEYYGHPSWGQEPQTETGYLLQKYMLHADLHLGSRVRLFVQVKSGLEEGRAGGPRAVDEDQLDVGQAFADLAFPLAVGSLTLRMGRQELLYGSGRLVSTREGPNVRQSFDGGRLILTQEQWRLDAFLVKPSQTNPGVFDDGWDDQRTFWGAYSVTPFAGSTVAWIDLYYFGLTRDGAKFDVGTGAESRHTMGARLWGRGARLDYDLDAVVQVGSFGPDPIFAWAAESDTGYTASSLPTKPRLGMRADLASGDEAASDHVLGTFNPLFPKASAFGEIRLIGGANLMDVHPSLALRLGRSVVLLSDWDFFWRQRLGDGLYGVTGNLIRSSQRTASRYIGNQLASQLEAHVGQHWTFVAHYTHFFAGPFLQESGPGNDVDYASTWMTYMF